MTDPDDIDDEAPIAELKDFALSPHPALPKRVRNDINRRTLAANGLEFSLTVMLSTFWEHLFLVIDAWPGHKSLDEESSKEEGQDG